MNIISIVGQVWRGADTDTLLLLYKSFVRFIIDYRLFCHLPSQKRNLKKLEGIQNKARTCSWISYERSKRPTSEALKNVWTVNRALFLGTKYLNNIFINSSHFVFGLPTKIGRKLAQKVNKNIFRTKLIFKCIRKVI